MPKTSTTWGPGTNPKGKGSSKNNKTKIKEAIGLSGWEALCEYLKTAGSDKLQIEMDKLKGKDYVNAFSSLNEYVKPKLNRTTVDGELNHKISGTVIFELDERFRDKED